MGVYPRVCGGTRLDYAVLERIDGLSPRVRGNQGEFAGRNLIAGSIPACAGEPNVGAGQQHLTEVYPRVCGGTKYRRVMGIDAKGLSPRVRGNLSEPRRCRIHKGSIPACAGEPPPPAAQSAAKQVYPRVCGGTQSTVFLVAVYMGLSPRVRGNRVCLGCLAGGSRSIPACAGEPVCVALFPRRVRVYPRVCGGTVPIPPHVDALEGLSPRVRGNLLLPMMQPSTQWSIPACAGEPHPLRLDLSPNRVYPRVCGGTYIKKSRMRMQGGLSPRVRGNLC